MADMHPNFIVKRLNKLATAVANGKMGDLLIVTSAIGWLASSLAQIAGIAFNKTYSKEQKKYMITQELADALTNIGLYCSITKSCTWLSSKLVSSGKLTTKGISEFLDKHGKAGRLGDFSFDVPSTIKEFDSDGKIKGKYDSLKNAADSVAALVGGVISSNIITPFVRNEIASYRQNNYKNKQLIKSKKLDCSKNQLTQPVITTRHTFEDFRRTSLSI